MSKKEVAAATVKKSRWDYFFVWVNKINTMMNQHVDKEIEYFLNSKSQFINLEKYICNFLQELKPDIKTVYKSRIALLGLSKEDYKKYTKHAYSVLDESIQASETKIRKALEKKKKQKEDPEQLQFTYFDQFLSEIQDLLKTYIESKAEWYFEEDNLVNLAFLIKNRFDTFVSNYIAYRGFELDQISECFEYSQQTLRNLFEYIKEVA